MTRTITNASERIVAIRQRFEKADNILQETYRKNKESGRAYSPVYYFGEAGRDAEALAAARAVLRADPRIKSTDWAVCALYLDW